MSGGIPAAAKNSSGRDTVIIDALRDGDDFERLFDGGGTLPLKVTGTSMLPLLHPGRSGVILEGISGDRAKRGDILLFRRENGAFVLHRVRKCLPDGRLLMNGDAQNWCEIISRERVVAVVRKIDSGGKIHDAEGLPLRLYRFFWTPTYAARPVILRAAIGLKRFFVRDGKRN